MYSYVQKSIQGTSLAYSVNDKNAANRHTQQYFTILGNRAIVKDGWKASAQRQPNTLTRNVYKGETPALPSPNPDTDVWELYNLNEDFNERIDLAKKQPEKLAELKALFDAEAQKYNIYPLLDFSYVTGRVQEQLRANKPLVPSGTPNIDSDSQKK